MRLAQVALVFVLTVSSSEVLARVITKTLTDNLDMEVPLYPGRAATLEFPDPIETVVLGNKVDYVLTKLTDTLWKIEPKHHAPNTNLNMGTWSGYVSMRLRLARPGEEPVDHIKFVAPKKAPVTAQQILVDQAVSFMELSDLSELTWQSETHALSLHVGSMAIAQHVVWPIHLRNAGTRRFPVESIQIVDHDGHSVSATFVLPSNIEQDASLLSVHGGLLGAFVFDSAVSLSDGWSVIVTSIGAVPPAEFRWVGQDRVDEKEGPLEGKLEAYIHAVGGATRLDDGLEAGSGRRVWTSWRAIGGQVNLGISQHTSIGVGFDFVQTGIATIDSVETHSTGGRVNIGGMLHTGRRFVPYAEAGLGFRLARHTFDSADSSASEFRMSGVLQMGGGMKWLISPRFLFGLSVAGSVPIGGDETGPVIEAGTYIGGLFGRSR